jgi:hypothetical protein
MLYKYLQDQGISSYSCCAEKSYSWEEIVIPEMQITPRAISLSAAEAQLLAESP